MIRHRKTVFVWAWAVLSLLATARISEAVILIGGVWKFLGLAHRANPGVISPSQTRKFALQIMNDPFNLPPSPDRSGSSSDTAGHGFQGARDRDRA